MRWFFCLRNMCEQWFKQRAEAEVSVGSSRYLATPAAAMVELRLSRQTYNCEVTGLDGDSKR